MELGPAQPREDFGEVHIARDKGEDIPNASDSAGPGIRVLLLVSWCVVDYKGSNPCLNLVIVSEASCVGV